VTRAEFQAIYERMSAEISRFARRASADILTMQGMTHPTPDCARRFRNRGRTDYARLLAACDQYDAAERDVPAAWLPPGEAGSDE